MGSLRQHFTGVAAKHLSAVDATPRSHQHEIGSNAFVQILGNPGEHKVSFEGTFLYFDDESDTPLKATGGLTVRYPATSGSPEAGVPFVLSRKCGYESDVRRRLLCSRCSSRQHSNVSG